MGLYSSKLNKIKPNKPPVINVKEEYNKETDLQKKAIQQIQFKRQAIKNSQKCRYIANNKFKTLFLITIIIFIIYLIYYEIPINGDYKEDTYNNNKIVNYLSILGYVSMNIFIVLLLTVLGIETYMIKDELRNLSDEEIITNKEIKEAIQNIPNIINQLKRQLAFRNPKLEDKLKQANKLLNSDKQYNNIEINGKNQILNSIIIEKNGSNNINNLINTFESNIIKLKDEYEYNINEIQKKIYAAKYDIEESSELNKELNNLHSHYNIIFDKVFNILN